MRPDATFARHCLARWTMCVLRSCFAFAAAATAGIATNAVGSALAQLLRLPPGGTARLAWDLAWVVFAGIGALVLCARLAPVARRMHALVLFAAIVALAVFGIVQLGGDFPSWFVIALLASLPVQGWLGLRWGVRAHRTLGAPATSR